MTSDIAKALTREDLAAMISEAIKRASDPMDYHQDALYHLKGILRETAPGPAVPERADSDGGVGSTRTGTPSSEADQSRPASPATAGVEGDRIAAGRRTGLSTDDVQRNGESPRQASDMGPVDHAGTGSPAASSVPTPAPSAPQGELRASLDASRLPPIWGLIGHRALAVWCPDLPTGDRLGRFLEAKPGMYFSANGDPLEVIPRPPLGGTAGATVVGDNWLNDVSGLLAGMGTPRSHDLLKQLAASREDALMKAVRALLENEFIVDSIGMTNDYVTLLTEYDILRRLHSPAPVEACPKCGSDNPNQPCPATERGLSCGRAS